MFRDPVTEKDFQRFRALARRDYPQLWEAAMAAYGPDERKAGLALAQAIIDAHKARGA